MRGSRACRHAGRYLRRREACVIPARPLRPEHPRRFLLRAARGPVAAARESRVHRVWHAGSHDVAAVPGWRAEIRYRLADLSKQLLFAAAMSAGKVAQAIKALLPAKPAQAPSGNALPGITVVIPSRNGKHLLETALPGVEREMEGIPSEIIIVDNGSSDGTAACFPQAILEVSAEPLSFA